MIKAVGGTRFDQLESVELLISSQFMNRMSENGSRATGGTRG